LRAYPGQEPAAQAANPVYHIHNGDVPASDMVVSFAMLLNLASVSGAEDRAALWKYLQRYAPDATPESHPGLDQAAGFAVRYFNDFVKPTRQPRTPAPHEAKAMRDLAGRLAEYTGPVEDEALQTIVFAVGKAHGFEPLRDWFKALYEVLMGASQGPRFGGFIALYGLADSIDLLERGASGALAVGDVA
ncbi:MAG: lysine--tRNA ligase, partial [Pseudomonadota bacterium]